MNKTSCLIIVLLSVALFCNAKIVQVNKSIITHEHTFVLKTIELQDTKTICKWSVKSRKPQTWVCMTRNAYLEGEGGRKYGFINSSLPMEPERVALAENECLDFTVEFVCIPKQVQSVKYYSNDSFYINDISLIGNQSNAKSSSEIRLQELFELSNNGDAEAQWELAHCYDSGYGGLENNFADLMYWMAKSAENGYPEAQYALALAYDVKQDFAKAFDLSKKAAEKGFVNAMYKVAYCYSSGTGVAQNYYNAVEWYKKAMANNHSWSFNNMAYLYFEGKGVPKSTQKAFELIDKAIQINPDEPGFYDTKGELLLKVGDTGNAMKMWSILKHLSPDYAANGNTVFTQYMNELSMNSDANQKPQLVENLFVVIISNENYKYESKVPYALNDGESFNLFCRNVLNVPNTNIQHITDATYNDMRYSVKWLEQIIRAYNGEARVIFYYAGHGIPDESQKTALLLPVDGNGTDSTSGYSLSKLYQSLGTLPSKSVMVFLDACFSGTKREGGMMASARGIAIKTKATAPANNMVVFSASQGDQTAGAYSDKQHGMFSYYMMQKLQESKGETTLGELFNYVQDRVQKQSVVVNKKVQTPTVLSSPTIGDDWKLWKLK